VRSSGSSTPIGGDSNSSALGGSTLLSAADGRSVSPVTALVAGSPEARDLILRGFAPHVAVVASADTDALLRDRGIQGGFLELVRPFGELVSGRVTVRDSVGASRTWDDFGVRFVGIKDSLGRQRIPGSGRPSVDSRFSEANGSVESGISRPSFDGRTLGGDISQIEEVVERHLNFAELRPSHSDGDVFSRSEKDIQIGAEELPSPAISPFYALYLRRMLSGLPLTPHETFSHPVACVIAISSRNASPIEEFKRLYTSTNTGDNRFPPWVNNEYLRYYVLVHDEDTDDIAKSTSLYEQMKRHFGLHCHLLRLRSAQCVPSDDDSIRLPSLEWMAAGEELAAIQQRGNIVFLIFHARLTLLVEIAEDLEDPTPCLFESDATALRTFVRELVTQSIVPGMERLCAQWNEQVANRRRGISGRFMSLTKRWTPFGSSRNASSPVGGMQGGSSSNYDSLQGFYRPDAPEALMRKLADYAFMLRDFKLAQSTYDLLRSDFEHDKAWKYYAGANEMCLVATLLNSGSRTRQESIERWLEAATHSYIHRCASPFYALRALLMSAECLQFRGSLGVDEPAAWASRTLDMNLPGPIGGALISERIAGFFSQKKMAGTLGIGGRRRKRGFWSLLATEAWIRLDKTVQAERSLEDVKLSFGDTTISQPWIAAQVQELQESIVATRLEAMGLDSPGSQLIDETGLVEEEVSGDLDARVHRRSLIPDASGGLASGEGAPISPIRTRETNPLEDEGFE
jgi:trafficking protein particle complex subunit 8